jgi:hypothetical protein
MVLQRARLLVQQRALRMAHQKAHLMVQMVHQRALRKVHKMVHQKVLLMAPLLAQPLQSSQAHIIKLAISIG